MTFPHLPAARTVAAGAGLLAAAALLTGCTKPQPGITLLSGSKSTIVSAQPLCFQLGQCAIKANRVGQITAAANSQILVDVPGSLAGKGWIVAAFTTDSTGKNTAVATPGANSAPIHGEHTVRLQVPQATSGGYYLQVSALQPTRQLTTWLVGVQLTQ